MRDTWAQGTPLYLPISLCGRMKSELWKLLETWEEVLGFLKVSTSQVVLSATLPTAPARFCSTKLRPVWRVAWEGLQQVSWSDFYVACSPTGRGEVLRKWASETTVSGDHFLSPQYSWWVVRMQLSLWAAPSRYFLNPPLWKAKSQHHGHFQGGGTAGANVLGQMPKPYVQRGERWAEHGQAWGQTRSGGPPPQASMRSPDLTLPLGGTHEKDLKSLSWWDRLLLAVFLADVWRVMWWWRVGAVKTGRPGFRSQSYLFWYLYHGPVAVSKPVSSLGNAILLPQAGGRLSEERHVDSFSTVLGPELIGNGSKIITAGMFTCLKSQHLRVAEGLYLTCPFPNKVTLFSEHWYVN